MVARPEQPQEAPRRRVPTSRYRRLEVRTWGDDKFQRLSPIPACAQGLWLYLLSGPFTTSVPGLVVGGAAAMAEALGWSLKAFQRVWGEIEALGMAKADWKNRLVWLPNGFRHNEPANPNVVLGWRPILVEIADCPLREEIAASLKQSLEPFQEPFREALAKALDKRLAQSGSGCRSQDAGPGDPSVGPLPDRMQAGPERTCSRCTLKGETRPAAGVWARPGGVAEDLCKQHLADCQRAAAGAGRLP